MIIWTCSAGSLTDNLGRDVTLHQVFRARTGHSSVPTLRTADRPAVLQTGMPKIIVNALMEEDWYVDPEVGVVLYEFDRDWSSGTYTMLHLLMDVRRHEHRCNVAPGGLSLKLQKLPMSTLSARCFPMRSAKSNWQPSTKNRFKLASTRSTFSGAGTWTGNNRFACQTGLCSAGPGL